MYYIIVIIIYYVYHNIKCILKSLKKQLNIISPIGIIVRIINYWNTRSALIYNCTALTSLLLNTIATSFFIITTPICDLCWTKIFNSLIENLENSKSLSLPTTSGALFSFQNYLVRVMRTDITSLPRSEWQCTQPYL